MATFRPLRILLLLVALCALVAHGVPLAQQGENFVTAVTVATVTVKPTQTTPTRVSEAGNSEIVGYVPKPDRRGTVGIITSCIITLFLCVSLGYKECGTPAFLMRPRRIKSPNCVRRIYCAASFH